MKTRMISIKDLVEGMVIANTVLSASGKVLLGKNNVVTARTIALLSMWDVSLVYIVDNESDPEPKEQVALEPEETEEPAKVFSKFFQQYDEITHKASQSFDFVRENKRIPIQGMKDTSFSIYSAVLSSGPAILDYLLVSDYNLADQVSRHSVMVAFISSVIGRQLKLPESDIEILVLAGLLHDIGKFVIPKEADANPLSHVISGAKLLRNVEGLPQEVILTVLQHHECMDGSGFPMAKSADKIHIFARIVAIADIFHTGAYKGDFVNPFPVLERISQERYSQLDPSICQIFLNKVRDSLINSPVLLSDGSTARIVFFNGVNFEHPVIKTASGTVLDLAAEANLSIQHILGHEYLANIS